MNPRQANPQYGDKERFSEDCRASCGSVSTRNRIGVLSEKTLHSVIKQFIEPNEALQELGEAITAPTQNSRTVYLRYKHARLTSCVQS